MHRPPGPIPIPILGNKWELPLRKPWYKLKQWTDKYGSIVTVWTGRRPTIVIGDPKVASDLLDKRSSIYSSRPRFVIMGKAFEALSQTFTNLINIGELFTNNDALLTMPYGERWRKTKKIFHLGLCPKACESYKSIQESESRRLARDLTTNPLVFGKHLERYAASVMFSVAYGRRVDSLDDPVVRKVYDRMGYMSTLNVPGAFWAESFPILKLIPDCLAGWKREVKRRGAEGTELLTGLALAVKTQMEKADAPPSFTKTLWERHNARPDLISQREIAYATGSLFGAGSDTTASTLMSFILAMTCFPHVAAKAQEEIDRVIPNDRSPTWSDMPMLPYCNAVIKETLRWRPVAVMGGTPHATTQDDYYQGHFIPKGTTIMGNLWAIHHNEKYFKDSHHFIPERYLEGAQDGTETYPGRDGHSAFGWGRRTCPGKLLAENSLFITITRILWGFNINKALDESGSEITPNTFAYTDGFNSKPQPFRCEIKPRDARIEAIINNEGQMGEEFLARYVHETKA
ncbi:cytochrome P450 [Peziza echinospora]|nr:cytochrome P450 [Peziza echinospora]